MVGFVETTLAEAVMPIKVCFLGSARYTRPLEPTSEKKFRSLSGLGEMFVIGFSADFKSHRFTEYAHFYLLPQLAFPVLRYLELFVVGQILIGWLIVRYGIQVVVAQSPYEGFVAALALKIAGCFGYAVRLVVEVHGDFEESLFLQRQIRFAGLYRFLMTRLAGYSIKQADSLRTISNSTSEQINRWAPEKTIVQFAAWTDIDTFLRSGIHTRRKDPDSIIYAGVLTPLKGIHHLINAFSLIAEEFGNAKLSIFGKDQNKTYAAELKKQITKLGLNDRVQFLGTQPQSELAIAMAKASVLVLPSVSEGLGRVVIEAMAAGTPVIGSRVGGVPELIEDGVTGFLVPASDMNALAEKLHWILSHPAKSSAMGKAARVFATRLFSTESYLKGYRQIFELAQTPSEHTEHAAPPLQSSN
jgi:glycosyltransferase involved in cell wall biosynthesis